VPVAQACNPSYSGGKNQEDHSSKPTGTVRETLSQNNPSPKRAGRVAQGVGPEFNPQYLKKKKKKQTLIREPLTENRNSIQTPVLFDPAMSSHLRSWGKDSS
jgi:hypothetical protein